MIKVAINGFGRIGRNIVRACYERNLNEKIQFVAINDLGDASINAHLLKYDTAHGEFAEDVTVEKDVLKINSDEIKVLSERDPAALPWTELGVDLVMECTGFFTQREAAAKHLDAGAKRVLISAPGKEVDAPVFDGIIEWPAARARRKSV